MGLPIEADGIVGELTGRERSRSQSLKGIQWLATDASGCVSYSGKAYTLRPAICHRVGTIG